MELDEKSLLYRYDSLLGWFPQKDHQGKIFYSRPISVRYNNRGFRDHDHKEKHKPRIVFVGDSFVWGYDVEQEERFTEILQGMIPDWEVINLGISGYGTGQEYLLLEQQFEFYKPDIVFLIFTGTDIGDNTSNTARGGYFKPYFVRDKDKLQVKGVPVPKAERYYYAQYPYLLTHSYLFRAFVKIYSHFSTPPRISIPDVTIDIIKQMKDFLEEREAVFIIGSEKTTNYEDLTLFYKVNNILFLDISNDYKYPAYGRHWTIAGHKFVSDKIYDFLKKEKLLGDKENVVKKDSFQWKPGQY